MESIVVKDGNAKRIEVIKRSQGYFPDSVYVHIIDEGDHVFLEEGELKDINKSINMLRGKT
jgi:hypothetical protein